MDVVGTVPMRLWAEWLSEGNLAGGIDERLGEYGFVVGTLPTKAHIGDRMYIVAHGYLRGYAPIVSFDEGWRYGGKPDSYAIVRGGGAVACTLPGGEGLPLPVRGFQGWRYRWWNATMEIPFPEWQTVGVA